MSVLTPSLVDYNVKYTWLLGVVQIIPSAVDYGIFVLVISVPEK